MIVGNIYLAPLTPERELKAGEFVLGYPDEMSEAPSIPQPAMLGRNGSYVAFRKLHQRVAAFRVANISRCGFGARNIEARRTTICRALKLAGA